MADGMVHDPSRDVALGDARAGPVDHLRREDAVDAEFLADPQQQGVDPRRVDVGQLGEVADPHHHFGIGITAPNLEVAAEARGKAKADTTVSRAQAAEQSLRQITESVLKLTDMNTQIATAAEEQTAVTDEIARNVETIRGTASRSADAAKASAETGTQLSGYSTALQTEVGHFRV